MWPSETVKKTEQILAPALPSSFWVCHAAELGRFQIKFKKKIKKNFKKN
jgi:hypothetical protein